MYYNILNEVLKERETKEKKDFLKEVIFEKENYTKNGTEIYFDAGKNMAKDIFPEKNDICGVQFKMINNKLYARSVKLVKKDYFLYGVYKEINSPNLLKTLENEYNKKNKLPLSDAIETIILCVEKNIVTYKEVGIMDYNIKQNNTNWKSMYDVAKELNSNQDELISLKRILAYR